MPSDRRDEQRAPFALLCQHFYPEMISTGMHMTELAEKLGGLGWEITVVCAQPTLDLSASGERVPRRLEHRGIRVLRVSAWGSHGGGLASRLAFGLTYLLSSLLAVVRRRERFAGLLITTNPPFLGLVGRAAKALFGMPYAMIVYDVYPDIAVRLGLLGRRSPLTWLWERVTRSILAGAEANVVIGRDMEELIAAKLPPARRSSLHRIPNWSDESLVRPVPREENAFAAEHGLAGRLVVQYAGRMARTHNLEPLVDAAERLAGRPVVFQLIGDGAKREKLARAVEERGLTNVQFLPYQPRERLDEVLSAADLAVVCLERRFTGVSVPSKTYGVMASGTPILAFVEAASEIGRTVAEHGCGVVLEDPDGASVAEVIVGLLERPERLVAMAAASRRAFEAEFTLTQAARRYSALLTATFAGGGAR